MTAFPAKPTLPKDADPAPPSTLFIFGASGDLTKRLVMPALYNLAKDGALDADFSIVGIDLVEHSEADFRTYLTEAVHSLVAQVGATLDEPTWDWLMQRTGYITGNFDDAATYASVTKRIAAGSGTTPQEVNQLLNQWKEAKKIMQGFANNRSGFMNIFGGR